MKYTLLETRLYSCKLKTRLSHDAAQQRHRSRSRFTTFLSRQTFVCRVWRDGAHGNGIQKVNGRERPDRQWTNWLRNGIGRRLQAVGIIRWEGRKGRKRTEQPWPTRSVEVTRMTTSCSTKADAEKETTSRSGFYPGFDSLTTNHRQGIWRRRTPLQVSPC